MTESFELGTLSCRLQVGSLSRGEKGQIECLRQRFILVIVEILQMDEKIKY